MNPGIVWNPQVHVFTRKLHVSLPVKLRNKSWKKNKLILRKNSEGFYQSLIEQTIFDKGEWRFRSVTHDIVPALLMIKDSRHSIYS